MYKIDFTLKQHTPLIHFQHDQAGATLRATEVKPKLDKYLDVLVFESDFERIKKYLLGYTVHNEELLKKSYISGKVALDYKISINAEPKDLKVSDIPKMFPCFFGNMGDGNQLKPKKFSFCNTNLTISFKSNHKQILEFIKDEIPNFFARNNFGNRQSKGFGSFYLDERDPYYQDPELFLLSYYNIIKNEIPAEQLFKEIEILHKVFRSGINDIRQGGVSHFYMKPLIWQYLRGKNISWEKRAIKQKFYPQELDFQIRSHGNHSEKQGSTGEWPINYGAAKEYRLVKDLLGLSSLENWRIPYKISITKSSNTIDRFKSPIFYKPIKIGKTYRVFLDAEMIPEEFHDCEFIISNGKNRFTLKTPVAEDFDITDFLIWCFDTVDIQECISPEFQKTTFASKVVDMFSELKSNLNV